METFFQFIDDLSAIKVDKKALHETNPTELESYNRQALDKANILIKQFNNIEGINIWNLKLRPIIN